METFPFFVNEGLDHVLDPNAYDHILFLAALAVPFLFRQWKQVIILATVFTITHCASLALSAFDIYRADIGIIETLIPLTILATAMGNIALALTDQIGKAGWIHAIATGVFGLIHGFGLSSHFNMLMQVYDEKLLPFLGFALGIELSQVIVILLMLAVTTALGRFSPLKQKSVVIVLSAVVIAFTIPLLF